MKKAFDIICTCLFALAVAFLFLYPEAAKNSVCSALRLCAESVVPSLFAFAVLSSLLLSSPFFASAVCSLPAERLFGISAVSSSAVVFGYLFGFPLGAKCAVDLYRSGKIEKTEAEILLCVSNNSGPAFIVNVIGGVFWKSRKFGLILYFSQLISGVLIGVLFTRLLFPVNRKKVRPLSEKVRPFTERFTEAVKASAAAMINICAYVCVFSVLTGLLKQLVCKKSLMLIISSFSELTTACADSAVTGGRFGMVLCGFAVGFSGLSVIFQAASFAIPAGIKTGKMFFAKLCQGVLCALLVLPHTPPTSLTENANAVQNAFATTDSTAVSFVLGAFLVLFWAKKAYDTAKIEKSLDLWR